MKLLRYFRSSAAFQQPTRQVPSQLIELRGLRAQPAGFEFYQDFLTLSEQITVLKVALQKLNSLESARYRRQRQRVEPRGSTTLRNVMDVFLPDSLYQFELGHCDGVIRNYRETHVSSWTDIDSITQEILSHVLQRVYDLLPFSDIQTHIIHLASRGEILPHIDNTLASGTHILGLSLGAPRVLKMESVDSPDNTFNVLLPSGSVYIQKDDVRYRYRHSVLADSSFKGSNLAPGARVSMMLRNGIKTKSE